jgi:sec-independent protein translocase protein TatA
MPNLGPGEIILVAAVVLLLFGARKLPEFARSLGKARSEFKKGMSEEEQEAEETEKPAEKPAEKP